MKKLLSTLLIIAATSLSQANAQESYLAGKGIAVFYPEGYDPIPHSPSPIFVQELSPTGKVPSDWSITPSFGMEGGQSVARLKVGEEVDLYGGGEVVGPLRRNGTTISFWNIDNPQYETDNGSHLYQSHPWIMGLRKDGSAFGIIADYTWKGTLTADSEVVFRCEGPAFRVVVIERESPQAIMQALSELSGHMELPPLWSLGYQQCRFSYYPDTRVKEIADSLRLNRIPCDVIWMDIHYMDAYKIFTFNKERFPDPDGLNNYLHKKGFKSVYMIDPGVKVEKGYWVDDQGCEADYWVKNSEGQPYVGNVWPGPCHFPDFTREDVRSWWSTLYPPFMAHGVDGIWNDMNEPSVFSESDMTMPKNNIHRGGVGLTQGPHLRFHNILGYNMVRASRAGLLLSNPTKRPFILSRSNFLGGQRYAATWTGDNRSCWEHLRVSIPMSITLGLSGQPFNGPDIGGFCSDCNADLLANWTAIGVYFPFTRNHTIDNSVNQEPWAFDEKTLEVCRTAINRRYVLMPYIYTLFEEASRNGMPVMRPAFMADPTNLNLRREEQSFMLGANLYITPRWADNMATPGEGWTQVKFEAKDDGMQALVSQRPGSIIPLANLCQNTESMSRDSISFLVNPDAYGKADGCLYEDAGNGFQYREGQFCRYAIKAATDGSSLTLSMEKTEGLSEAAEKTIRIGLVTIDGIVYSPWTKGNSVSMTLSKRGGKHRKGNTPYRDR